MDHDSPKADFDGWIGREEECAETLTDTLVSRFRATFDMPPADERTGAPAPRLIHFCLCQPIAATSALGRDGHPAKGGFLPPIALPRRMWAGSDIRFQGQLRIGDRVRRHSRIARIDRKHGRSGSLYFVTVEHKIEGSDGSVDDRQTIVYRDLEPTASASTVPASPDRTTAQQGSYVSTMVPGTTLLFRYSALTFNSHRIHYDVPYACDEEGYADLVVHGPLQATLLYHHACRVRGCEPDGFSFRGQSPMLGAAPMELHGTDLPDGSMELWTARPAGPLATRAKALWA
jgi:3-methylfumaryl-CoA hydratase